ncbi:metal-dependent hydrolase [Paenibacillus methanolicus]|uniref:Inner membrane protein n=1 Tax=Paenibacillus methanolicus TaxID=582686 RepID=A0A5S5C465_9BACL|nr:metal-dependent hydrolase [Paenibacillus methanolicus]TYP72743.1 inner membrane protein [Paenibacillus methanolicus]
MKGRTHLTIGIGIGAVCSALYADSLQSAGIYLAVAGFSSLSADLDGTSMLSSKLGKLSRLLRSLFVWGGAGGLAACVALYFGADWSRTPVWIVSGLAFMLGLLTQSGFLRDLLVSLIGAGLVFYGWPSGMTWLIGLGVFIAIAPWLNHRGMTHTVWAAAAWAWIGLEFEGHYHVEHAGLVAVYGYLSHLIADTLTPSGVKWFYPLLNKSLKLRLFK